METSVSPRNVPPKRSQRSLQRLLGQIGCCRACAADLPFEPRPILRAAVTARLLIVGQAPGRRVHESGIPWDDSSGERLRHWMGIDRKRFYDQSRIAIVPMGFCYPGRGRSGDLPPRAECAELWLQPLRNHLRKVRLTLLVGRYAQAHYLGRSCKASLTETVRAWQEYQPDYLPLPHPSGRNNIWLRRNGWFEAEVVPMLRRTCRRLKLV